MWVARVMLRDFFFFLLGFCDDLLRLGRRVRVGLIVKAYATPSTLYSVRCIYGRASFCLLLVGGRASAPTSVVGPHGAGGGSAARFCPQGYRSGLRPGGYSRAGGPLQLFFFCVVCFSHLPNK